MEEKIQVRASLGSKLPQFGGPKPLGSFLQRTTNGTHASLSGKSNITSGESKHSDLDRTAAFSLNWRKLKYQQSDQNARDPTSSTVEKVHDVKRYSQSHVAGDKDVPRLEVTSKTGKQHDMLVSQKDDLNENLLSELSNSTKFIKATHLGRTSYSGLNGSKTQVNGFFTNRPSTGLQRPRANSATARNCSNKVLAQPTDNVKSFSYVRRSQSFSHSIQNTLHPSAPLSRSHSFNREVELTRPYETQHVSIRTTPAPKQSLLSRSARQCAIPNGNEAHIKTGSTRIYSGVPASGFRKPSLSNGSVVTIPLGYKMSRPPLLKPSRPQFPREMIIDGTNSTSVVSSIMEKTEPMLRRTGGTDDQKEAEEKVRNIGNYVLCDNLEKQDFKDGYYGDDVDELSISSLSSSDKNDLSEDFSDDFIDLEDGNKTVIAVEPEESTTEKESAEQSLGSLQDSQKCITKTDDWMDMNITVRETESANSPYGDNRISPDMDYREPSSLELSPSDSSDGTYMWDEEGMEPIGNVHPCGSYESSEIHSLDILNNLDSCDLEDDDLMLDVDLPEDAPCEIGKGENMSHFERTERNVRPTQQVFWKRTPQRLNGQEQYHLGNADHYHHSRGSARLEPPTNHRERYGTANFYQQAPRTTPIVGLRENTVMLDEMTLRHMVQDCTAVKIQLLKLKQLLQQGDDCGSLQDLQLSIPTTPEPQDSEIIWKPPVLQCSSRTPSSTDQTSIKIKPPCIEAPSKHAEQIQSPVSCSPTRDAVKFSKVPETELSVLLSTQLKINDLEHHPEEVKKTEEYANITVQHVTNEELGTEPLPSALLTTSPGDTKKDLKSKLMVKTTVSAGQAPRSKTSQLYKPKTQNTLVHQETTNLRSLNVSPTCKELQMRTMASSPSLAQPTNDYQSVVQKRQQQLNNDCSVDELSVQVTPDVVPCLLQPLSATTDQAQSPHNRPCSRQSFQSLSPSTGISKILPVGSLPTQLQVTPVEPPKQASKQSPKSSMLRPPSNFVSKLKKTSSPKSDVAHSPVASHEPPKSPLKTTASVIPRPLSYKKESLQEAGESLAPKRHSRLPQPKTH
ncbi:hypothetical protein FKM82_015262 [Ascaphus truei]|uniref:serine-rich coiled-coil domain-containing protein 2 isoform X3 n=1 Tax=Ascaphus truei TaxID=8439 RepID=UPI003F596419